MTQTEHPAAASQRTTIRFVVQWQSARDKQWRTHDAGPDRPGAYRDLADARRHFRRELPHHEPGTLRVVRSVVVSTWTPLDV
jgi:hypothetical protein